MNRFMIALLLFVFGAIVSSPPAARACPFCKEIMTNSAEVEEGKPYPYREAQAWNNSILFMVTVPYVVLGVCSCYVWRSLNQLQQPPRSVETAEKP
jgi:hypothetical protein